MLGMPPASGKPRLRLPKEGPGKAAGTGARAPGWWGSWEPPPGVSAYGGEGVDRAPLAVLLGVGARALWMAGEILGGLGPPQIRAPPLLVGASPARDLRAAHWPPLCGNQPGADGTGDQRPQHPASGPHGGLPGLRELGSARPAPQDDARIRTPLSRRRGPASFGICPPPRHRGPGQRGRRVGSQTPWASDIIFWSRGGGEEERLGGGGGSLEGLGAPGRQEGMGRPWLGPQAWQGEQSGGVSLRPCLGGPRGRFSSP